ncbi:CAP protein [Ostertagia ostertagi]
MDPLYLDIPRPFSKFPVGYRPVSRGGGVIRTMSSLSLDQSRNNAFNAFYDQGMPPPQLAFSEIAQGYSVSPESNMYRTTNPPTRNVHQSSLPASVEHIADVGESFPEMNARSSGDTPRDGRSSVPIKNSYGGAALLAELGSSDEFRWKLRRQREKIEDYRRQIDCQNNNLNLSAAPHETVKINDSKVAWRNGNVNRRGSFTQSNSYPKSVLYKTQSDSSLFQDLDYGPYPPLNSELPQIPQRTTGSVRQSDGFGRLPSSVERKAPMEGFFASKSRQDPVWVTSPPPPFKIPRGHHNAQIVLLLKQAADSPSTFTRWAEDPPLSTYDHVPTNLSFAVEAGQAPVNQHNLESGASNTAGRLQFATIETEPNRIPSRSPLEVPLSRTSLHEYIAKRRGHSGHHFTHGPNRSFAHNAPDVPAGISHAPSTHQQSSSERNSPTRDFNEQGSNLRVGTNFMRGLCGSNMGNGGVVHSIPRTSRKAQVLLKERSFAIISRPLTPPAILQNISDVVDLGSQYRQVMASESLNKMRRGSEPISSPVAAISPPGSDSFNRNLGSPLSSYDNTENEERFRSHQAVQNISSNQAQQICSTPAHGILLKNTEGVTRPSKKVVFQCDSLEADRCLQANVNSTEPPPHVKAYDAALGDVIENWSAVSDQIGGDVKLMREKVTAVFSSLRIFLWTAACQVEPSTDEVQKLVSPIVNLLSEINSFKDSRRKAPQFNHLCAVAEGIPAVGWVLVKKTPAAHVKEMLDSSMFYINRVLKEFKDGDQKNIEWARLWKNILETMHTFVRQTHTTGLEWNSAPGCSPPPSDARLTGSHSAAQGPPPPPPPPPPGLFAADNASAATVDAGKAGRDALFAELNKGEAVTAGLRKVTADMQTHKNPALREHVKGKLNSITLDSCRKTSVVFDAVVAQCETINCQRIEIQTLGEMPTISIQKTDGCQVYLSQTSKNAEIVTSKSSEMNVLIPKSDGDYMEFPIPEQFKTTFDGGKLVTCVSDIS